MADADQSAALRDQVLAAVDSRQALSIRGGASKAFLGRVSAGQPLELAGHRGVVSYEPTELVITARSGTPLAELRQVLAGSGQMLPFEPPAFGAAATIGGTIACGLSGPARPFRGAARDLILGVRIINGRGELLGFGGQVMKNVAGYDLSRLMAGAFGTLGLLLEVSMKVLPRPTAERTLRLQVTPADALERMNRWAGEPLPLSALCHDGEALYARLSGAAAAVASAARRLGGDTLTEADAFWESVREQSHPFFAGDEPLWRVSVPPAAPPLDLPGPVFLDWGGGQRWLRGDMDGATVYGLAARAGGQASLFRGGDRAGQVFQPLVEGLSRLHRNLKAALDPHGIFNPGRMYAGI